MPIGDRIRIYRWVIADRAVMAAERAWAPLPAVAGVYRSRSLAR